MTFVPQNLVYVYYQASNGKQLMERLLLKTDNGSGLNVPEVRFFPSRRGSGFFGLKRLLWLGREKEECSGERAKFRMG
ncbi:hypothetical protein [Legionella shakespearei]|uniref:Uncharacterized protein n=1 Tax=Legionella shakespearei DSM 23087 TaxID=1122169 RepID=A0A0W0YV21_9GAMM|nr:hypothetical protein [Legionella shakespearei]KTD60741.1 hypothetical protein Lsha_1458 [Legionella shakespearei DSM 23087]